MIPKGLFSQIAMVAVSVAIIALYVEPAFSDIAGVQDNIAVYQEELQKVSMVNATLNRHIETKKSVALVDQAKLARYLPDPDDLDDIAVLRDLALISIEAGVLYKEAVFLGEDVVVADQTLETDLTPKAMPMRFSFGVEGTYGQIKNLFSLLEQNDYPIEISALSIDQIEGGFLGVEMEFVTYAYQSELSAEEIVF